MQAKPSTLAALLVVVVVVVVSLFGTCVVSATATREEAYLCDDTEMLKRYPGTAVERLRNVQERVRGLSTETLQGDWPDVRRKLLWAGGLRDLENAQPGKGYTGHAFNDYNHVDLTTMRMDVADEEHDGRIPGIARGNPLGEGIRIASTPDLGPGGSWSTCQNGAGEDPPHDVAHVQFQSAIAFKLVWCPPSFDSFVLVDDDGELLNRGKPSGNLPPLQHRRANYQVVEGSKYARACGSD
ncbi:Hypothetical Protein FCC1311_011982 [Hondaea fermentalgiana]|uniref:Uncharacterized protein n=1 Tax=Hondaea fermentalgiana TaxID=2315210 RepID=A0A2R5GA58_9STRA|nr:Hypothetical Protein FCC1311_011982 [Hondaea fermentalgiana]|eukprot:GBG24981.1 Hypothetical Protein FCC1311_011982 [Hondaea fermentalgiana]